MALEGRRALKTAQEELVPKLAGSLKALSNADIPVEIEEATLLDAEDPKGELESLQLRGFGELLAAMKDVCKDDMGKDAVQKGLKKILFKHLPADQMSHRSVTMTGGVLTIANYWNGSGYLTANEIRKAVEQQI